MKTLTLALSIVIGTAAHAAGGFEQTCGGPETDRGVFVNPTRDGGYIVVGVTESFGAGKEDVYLVRTDAAGEVLWSRTFGGPDDDFGWSVVEVADGFVLAGSTSSFGNGSFDFYLVKTDRGGEAEWSRTFGGEGSDRCWALARTTRGGFVLAGETTSSGEGEQDCYLVETDSLGTMLWSRSYGGAKSDRCFAVAPAADGGYMLAGQTYSEGAGDRDAYVLKTAADGELEWSRTFGGEASDVGHSITRTRDGDFVVTGYTTSFATGGDDPYLIRIDAHGETRWTRVLPLEGVAHTLTGDEAADGGFYLVGLFENPFAGVTAALLVRTDDEGHLSWRRDILPTRIGETFGYSVRATADGGCVFTGHTTVGSAGDRDLLLVRVEP